MEKMEQLTILISTNKNQEKIKNILLNAQIRVDDIYNTNDYEKCLEVFDIAYRGLTERVFVNYDKDFIISFKDIYDRTLLEDYNISILEQKILEYISKELTLEEKLKFKESDMLYILSNLSKEMNFTSEEIMILDVKIRNLIRTEVLIDRKAYLKEIKEKIKSDEF